MVDSRQKILLYGKSLVLSGLQSCLKMYPGLDLVALDETTPDTDVLDAHASIVIFDMTVGPPGFLYAQLQARDRVLLIGIDPESHEILLTGPDAALIGLEQIAQLVLGFKAAGTPQS